MEIQILIVTKVKYNIVHSFLHACELHGHIHMPLYTYLQIRIFSRYDINFKLDHSLLIVTSVSMNSFLSNLTNQSE